MKLLTLLSVLIPVLSTAHGQSSVSLGLSASTTPITRTSQIAADEGETVRICLNTNFDPPSSLSTVRLESEDNTATAPDDYSSISTTLTFDPQVNTEECVSTVLVADDLDEPDETLTVTITGQTGYYSDFEAIVTVSISGGSNGGNFVGISLEQDSYDVSESDSSIEVCAVQNGVIPVAGNIVVVLWTTSASDSTAATAGSDYVQTSGELTFAAANAGTRLCVNIPIMQDELDEGSEVFQVSLMAQNSLDNVFIGSPRTATVTIADESSMATTEPSSDTPVTTEPSADTPVTTEPSADTPVTTEPSADTPVTTEPSADTPVTTEPSADTPVTTEPSADTDATPSEDPNTDGDTDTDDGTTARPGGDGSNSNPSNTDSDSNGGQTVGVQNYGVIVKSLSPILLLLASILGLLL